MKGLTEIIGIEKLALQGVILEKSSHSPLVIAKKEIYLPEKKIIRTGQAPEQEALFVRGAAANMGGLIL